MGTLIATPIGPHHQAGLPKFKDRRGELFLPYIHLNSNIMCASGCSIVLELQMRSPCFKAAHPFSQILPGIPVTITRLWSIGKSVSEGMGALPLSSAHMGEKQRVLTAGNLVCMVQPINKEGSCPYFSLSRSSLALPLFPSPHSPLYSTGGSVCKQWRNVVRHMLFKGAPFNARLLLAMGSKQQIVDASCFLREFHVPGPISAVNLPTKKLDRLHTTFWLTSCTAADSDTFYWFPADLSSRLSDVHFCSCQYRGRHKGSVIQFSGDFNETSTSLPWPEQCHNCFSVSEHQSPAD
eukprot:1151581-Pelagomonas_calceolata.AAC.7